MALEAVAELPVGEWIYELKIDGYRALLIKDGAHVELRSRTNKILTTAYHEIVIAGQTINAEKAVIDGEIVVIDAQGKPSFQALQNRGRQRPNHQIVFYAFDVLHLNGDDTTALPLEERRSKLDELVQGPVLRISQELPGTAAQVVAAVRAMGLEGVVAKRKGSAYVPGGRSRDWLKLKLATQQEFVIGGYRADGEKSIDALIVGYYEGTRLRFASKVRAGFVPHMRRELAARLAALRIVDCPFDDLPTVEPSRWGAGITSTEMMEMRWTRPELVAQIKFREWTEAGRLREAAYLGLRTDKAAHETKREL